MKKVLPAQQTPPIRERRGATLVVVAIMFTMLVSFAALGLDFSRMYSFKNEIKRSADAGAMSFALDRAIGVSRASSESKTFALNAGNTVEGSQVPTMASGDLQAIHWEFSSSAITNTSWTDATTNGARVSTRYTANWTLGKVFSSTSKTLYDTSYAAFGSLTTSSCLKPIAISYASLLAKLQPPQTNTSWTLSQTDVEQLNDYTNSIPFIEMNKADGSPGGFGWVDVAPGSPGTKNDKVAAALEPGACTSGSTGNGSTLQGVPGTRSTFQDALDRLCGGVWTGHGNNAEMLCSGPEFLVPIYDFGNGSGGNNATYHVKYIGAFKLYKQDNKDLFGYLTAITVPPSGTLSNAAGPAMSAVIVK